MAAAPCPDGERCKVKLTSAQLFDLAERFERGNEPSHAHDIYDILAKNPDIDIRNEARFRHAQLLLAQNKLTYAAVLYRAILDEKPDAQAVRLQLAAVLYQMGDLPASRRLLRQAQAGGLPPEVAQIADQYAASMRSQQPIGASIEISMAPTTNINRATSDTTLDTIVADLELSDDARAQSGVGIRIGGQINGRHAVSPDINLVGRISSQSSLYRDSSFNDLIGAAQIGLETQTDVLRLRSQIGRSYRWYGKEHYATTDSVSVDVLHPLDSRSQIEASFGLGTADYKWNDLQDGLTYNASVTYERAFSARTGGSLGLVFDRQEARDPSYATTSVGAQALLWRDIGQISLYGCVNLSGLKADERAALFREVRKDLQFRAVAGATFRQLTVAGFAPLVRVTYERNASTVGIYDYSRFGGEIGIARAF